jgi:hypothetical protein
VKNGNFRLGAGLKITSAQKLCAEHLVVIGACPPDAVSNLCAPNRPLTLAIANVPPHNIYELLETWKLGPRIADLRFESINRCCGKGREQVERNLNMFRVLAACPNVSTLHFGGSFYDLSHEDEFGLNAESFQNYHRYVRKLFQKTDSNILNFSIKIAPIVYPKQEDIISILKIVLLGSQKCKNIVLTDMYQLKAMMEVVRENVASLRFVKTVDINIHNIVAEQLKIFTEGGHSGHSKEKIIYGVSFAITS